MTATKTQLTGGIFQDSEGNVLNLGYLVLKLNQDNNVSGVGNICSGIEVKILLNSSGSVSTSPQQFIWATDVMTVTNPFYTVTGYTASGQRAWGPNNQQVTSGGTGGGTFDCGLWIPNSIFSWTPPVQPVALETNGVKNALQTLLNLISGSNITLTADGAGGVTIAASAPAAIALKTNGTPNGSQTILNLKQSTGITVADDGVGGITITNSNPGGTVPAGYNVVQTPSWGGTSVYPENSVYQGTINTAGGTIFQQITSGMLLCQPTSFKATIYCVGTATITMVVVRCTRGTGTVVAQANVTFGGLSSPSLGLGFHQSDAINFSLVSGFDYYFALDTSSHLIGYVAPGTAQVGFGGGGSRVTASSALPIGGSLPSWTSSLTESANQFMFDLVSA